VQDGLGIVGVRNELAQTHDVTALLYKVLNVVVSALVSQLSHLDTFRGELFIQIEQVETRWGQVLHTGKENSSLQLGHRCFKLWGD